MTGAVDKDRHRVDFSVKLGFHFWRVFNFTEKSRGYCHLARYLSYHLARYLSYWGTFEVTNGTAEAIKSGLPAFERVFFHPATQVGLRRAIARGDKFLARTIR